MTKSAIGKSTKNHSEWILGFLIITILIIALLVFAPKYQSTVDKFMNLDLEYQQSGGGYASSGETILTKWNGDNYQKLKLNFSGIAPNTQISKIKLDFKDINTNNLYTYSAENATKFEFDLNLPENTTFMLYIYINDSADYKFMTYIKTNENYFRFTDINENELTGESIDNILLINIIDPDSGNTTILAQTNRTVDLGSLKMQPYNMVKIPVRIPNLSEYKNKLKASTSIDSTVKAKHDAKLAALDNYVFKEIQASVMVIKLPPSMLPTTTTIQGGSAPTINPTIAQEYKDTGLSRDELTKFESKYPNRVKVTTPGVSGCIQGDTNKCGIQIKNLVNGATYKVQIRAIYQMLGSIEPNIRYTKPQTIYFSVNNSTNLAADLNEQIKLSNTAQQYVLNQEQKSFIKQDQMRQDYNMSALESDINTLSKRIQFTL